MPLLLAFDLMGTLLADPYVAAHEAATGRPMAELFRLGLRAQYHRLERAEITEQEYWEFLRGHGILADTAVFHHVRRTRCGWLPVMREVLAEFGQRCQTVVATNYPVWIDQLRAELFGGLDVGWYPSCWCGVRKPDPRYFVGLCATFGVRAADLVLVDDKAVNTDAVRQLGGRAITFDPAADTRARLTALLS